MLWLAAIPGRAWAALALVAALVGLVWFAYTWSYDRGVAVEHLLREADRVAHVAALDASVKKGQDDTRDLQRKADDDRTSYNSQMQVLGAAVGSLTTSLQSRAARPPGGANVSGASGTGQGCTGAQLYRDDAIAFAREAARADGLRAALAQCYRVYDNAREKSLTPPLQ